MEAAPYHFDSETPYRRFDLDRAKWLIEHYLALREDGINDSEALGEALESVRPLVHIIVSRYTAEDDQPDVEQDILVHLMTALPTYDRNPDNLNAWLNAVIRNKAISLWRSRMIVAPPVTVPLDDEFLAETEDPDPWPDPEAIIPHAALLAAWLAMRFPSLPPDRIDQAAELIAGMLADGKPDRQTIHALRKLLEPPLRCGQVISIYDAALVFLRALSLDDSYLNAPPPDFEFSLMPELRLVAGDVASSYLYTLFRGMELHFRVR